MNEKLKLALIRVGEPQYVVANRAGLDETRMSRIVRGRVAPTDEEKRRIAEAVGGKVAELFPAA